MAKVIKCGELFCAVDGSVRKNAVVVVEENRITAVQNAEQYAQKNQNLILVARRLDRLELIKSRLIAKYPIDVKVLSADLGDALALQQFIEEI